MKILHLVGDCEDAGGVFSVIRNLHSVSHSAGWRHILWVNARYEETRKPALEYRFSPSVLAESANHFALLKSARPASRELFALCQQESFDVFHAHSRGTLLVALLFSKKTHRPVLYTNHNYAKHTWLYRWAARHPSMHTVVLTENMAKHYGLVVAGRVHQISACFPDSFLEKAMVSRSEDSHSCEKIRLIGVGNMIGWKKWDLAIEAIHRLEASLQNRIDFHIWGPTLHLPESIHYEHQIRSLIDRYALNAIIHLGGATNDVENKLRQSDCFLLPSTNEPCSVALMEALALGLPAIVSRSGGNVDLVQEGCGLTFMPDDPDSLKDVLQKIITSPSSFHSPSIIRNSVRHRCASRVFESYQRIYQNLMKASANR